MGSGLAPQALAILEETSHFWWWSVEKGVENNYPAILVLSMWKDRGASRVLGLTVGATHRS